MNLENISPKELENELNYRYDIVRTYQNEYDGMKNTIYAEIEYIKILLANQID